MMERSDLEQWKSREVARLLALVETERRYWQEIVSTLPVPLAILNSQLILVSANRAFRTRFAVRNEDLRSRRLDSILPYPELTECVQRSLHAPGNQDPVILEKPGGGGRLRVTVQPHRDWDEDTAIQVLLAVEDLSLSSDAPGARSVKAQTSLAATLPAVVWTATLPAMQFSMVSDSSLTVTGIPAERWLDPGFWIARFDEQSRESVVSAYNKAFAAGPGTYSFEFRLAGNPTSWFRETIRIDDDRAGVQGVLTDVTDRRALEEHLLQRQRVEALASFAGRAAHDLNNPLMIISGYGEELFESLTETDPRRNDLGQMLAAAKRIGDIAAGMQQFSRKPSPAIASSADASLAIDLAALLVETVDRMRNTAGPSLKVDYVPPSPNTDPVLVFADSGVLQNLIYEITAAMADGAPEVHIAIQAHMRLVREQAFGDQLPSGVYASVTVENRGETATGASARRSMFETILPGKDGSEVGPALAKAFRLVESWGGSIWTSANGGFVRILLRALKPAQADVEATQAVPVGPVAVPMQPTPPPPPPPKRILVVDDEMGIRSLMRKILMREGYSVLEAASAKEAMAAIEQEPVDLLLTDVIMPETSGRQLAEQVVAKYPETRVLYVSGYTGETLVESGQFPPGSRLLQKPVTLGSLLRAVKEVLAETSSGKQSRVAAASAGSAGQ